MNNKNLTMIVITFLGGSIFISACNQRQSLTAITTNVPTTSIILTSTEIPSSTPTHLPTYTPAPTLTPTISPTPIGGGNGTIIFTDGWTLYSINTNGKNKTLIDENCSWNMTFSPDGHYLVCSQFKNVANSSWHGFGIILIDLETNSVAKRFLESIEIGHQNTIFSDLGGPVSWSTDSKRIAVGGFENGNSKIFIVNVQDSTLIQIPTSSSQYNDFKWSPDGKMLAFTELVDGLYLRFNTYIVNSDGTDLKKLKDGGREMTWGENSDELFVDGQGVDLKTALPNGKSNLIKQIGSVISPDGKIQVRVDIFTHKVFLQKIGDPKESDITEFFNIDLNYSYIKWSADSKYLAYYEKKTSSILLMPIDTLNAPIRIKVNQDNRNKYAYYFGKFLWLPDGKEIVFIQADESGGFLVSLSDLSGNITPLFSGKNPVNLNVKPLRK